MKPGLLVTARDWNSHKTVTGGMEKVLCDLSYPSSDRRFRLTQPRTTSKKTAVTHGDKDLWKRFVS